jgi:hypothetical protein
MSTIAQMTVKLFADTSQFVNGLAGAGSASRNAAGALEASAIAAQKEQLALDKAAVAVQVQTERLARMKTAAEGSAEAANKNATRIEQQRIRVQEAQLALAELNTKQNLVTDSANKSATAIAKSGDAASGASGHMNGLTGAADGVAKVLSAGVAIAATAAVAGIAALAAAMAGGVKAASDWGDQLDSIGDVLGTNASDSAALAVAIKGVGGNLDGITTQLAFMSKGLVDTKGQLGPTGEALKKLGVNAFETGKTIKTQVPAIKMSADEHAELGKKLEMARARYADLGKTIATSKHVSDTQRVTFKQLGAEISQMEKSAGLFGKTVSQTMTTRGPMKDSAKLLVEVATKIDKMPDGLEKSALMMEVFGKSGKDMSDTIHAIAGSGLEEARKKAQAFGLDLGEDGVSNAIAFKRGMADLGMAAQGLAVTIGNALLPTVLPLVQQFGQWAQGVMPQVAVAVGVVAARVGAFVSGLTTGKGEFGQFGQFAQQAFAQIQATVSTVIAWLTANWPQISATISAGLQAVGTVVQTVIIPAATTILQVLGQVVGWVIANWPAISATIGSVLGGIATFANTYIVPFVTFLLGQLQSLVGWVQENWPLISLTIEVVFAAIKRVVDAVAPVLFGALGDAITKAETLISGAVDNLKTILKLGMDLLTGSWNEGWAQMLTLVQTQWANIETFFQQLPTRMLNYANEMMAGFVKGINDGATNVLNALKKLVEDIVTDFKKKLGIASPSTVFAGIGANMAQGLAVGYRTALQPLALPALLPSPQNALRPAYAGTAAATATPQPAYGNAPVVINVHIGDEKLDSIMYRSLRELLAGDSRRYSHG